MAWNRLLAVLLLVLCGESAFSLNEIYFIYFKDKNQQANFKDIFSERAIKRRTRLKIPLHFSDFPVNSNYVQNLVSNPEIKILFASKWLNGVLVECDAKLLEGMGKLPFVSEIKKVTSIKQDVNRQIALQDFNQNQSIDYGNSLMQIQNMGADKMHEDGFTGKGIFVAVFDGGFYKAETASSLKPLFQQDRIKFKYNLVVKSDSVYGFTTHGTNVLSCIGSYAPGNLVGTGYGADFALFVTENVSSESLLEEYNWLKAAELADSLGVDIISSSLGYNTFDNSSENHSLTELDGKTTVITKAAVMATQKGILVVSSAGNNYSDATWPNIVFPSDADSILSVGAVSSNGQKASFSAIGPTKDGRIKPDVSALGVGVIVNNSGDTYTTASGTSYSAPLVAGLAAGLWETDSTISNIFLLQCIKQSATLYCSQNNQIGAGIPNYTIACQLIKDKKQLNCDSFLYVAATQILFPNPVFDQLTLDGTNLELSNNIRYRFTDTSGKELISGETGNPGYLNLKLDVSSLKSGIYFLMLNERTYKVLKR